MLVSGDVGATSGAYFVPADDSLETTWTEPSFDDAAWSHASLGFGFDTSDGDLDGQIQTVVDFREDHPDATTLLVRIPFQIDDIQSVADNRLILRMKYDDGFVAYINGQQAAARNVNLDALAWNEGASRRADEDAVVFQELEISHVADHLVTGQNLLAIRLVNDSATNSDLLVLPELITRRVDFEPRANARTYVTIDGSDPRGPDGLPSPSARLFTPGGSLAIDANVRLTARVFDDITDRGPESAIVLSDWSAPVALNLVVDPPRGTPGDFDGDGVVGANDIDLLAVQMREPEPNIAFDLNADGKISSADRDTLVFDLLVTVYGDANLDGHFDSDDLLQILDRGEYDDDVAQNSTWAEGDWDGDGDFTPDDLLLAFGGGGFRRRAPVARPDIAAAIANWPESDRRLGGDPPPAGARVPQSPAAIQRSGRAVELPLVARDRLFGDDAWSII